MLKNIFGYSFVQYLWYRIYLNFHCFWKRVKNGNYWSKMIQYGSKITQNMKMAEIVQKNLGQIIWYFNTFEYFRWIYSFAKYLLIFSRANIFRYSFVIFLSLQIYSDIHSSNIYGSEYIRIFICPKKIIFVPHYFKKNLGGDQTFWVIMYRKNSDLIHLIFSPSLLLQCALMCLPGSPELSCSRTAPQCESPQFNLVKSKCLYILRQIILNNFKLSYLLNR